MGRTRHEMRLRLGLRRSLLFLYFRLRLDFLKVFTSLVNHLLNFLTKGDSALHYSPDRGFKQRKDKRCRNKT